MATTMRQRRPTREQFLAEVEQGLLDDRLDLFLPPEAYGPPTAAELATARPPSRRTRTNRANGKTAAAIDGKRL